MLWWLQKGVRFVCCVGSTQVNEARDAFDVFDSADGLLAFEDVGKVLEKLGFDAVSPLLFVAFATLPRG